MQTNKISSSVNILSISNWENIYDNLIKSYNISQYEHYKKNGSSEKVLEIVSMESKRFGSIAENIVASILNIGKRTSSENDGLKNNKKIEIKCARYWAGTNDCKWQHLEKNHDYDCVLFGLLDFNGDWKIWGIKKSLLFGELIEKKVLTYQGNQGWWCKKNDVVPYCSQINSISDLDQFLDTF